MPISILRPSPIKSKPKLTSTRGYADDGDVSPIDEMPDISKVEFNRPSSRLANPTSSIPVLRREAKRNQVAAAAANFVSRKGFGDRPKGRISKNPKFDPYTGEVTTSERGKPQSAKPGEFVPPGVLNVHNGMTMGNETIVSGAPKQHTSFSDRVRNFKGAAPERPEWKGATGRVAIVPPVADNPTIKTLNIPRKSSKRVASPVSDFRSQTSSPVTVIRGDSETSPISPVMQSLDPAIRTVIKGHRAQVSEIDVKPDPYAVSQSAASKALARGPSPTEVKLSNSETVGKIERDFRSALKESFPRSRQSEEYVQPPSRFSVTTYAPSEAQSSPRPSTDTFDRPPMPHQTPPQSHTFQQQSPIVNRRRPKVNESPKSQTGVTRKAVPRAPGSPVFISMTTSYPVSKRSSSLSMATKNLPMSPAEAQSNDLVSSLQAQLEDLAHRRMNVTRSIRQMTQLMPQDRVLMTDAVRIKRENEKLMIERLKIEEADVRREEHEVGLRLHRAWKRRDKDAEFEPTGLWVRRVGSG
jgi:hypothetical protein